MTKSKAAAIYLRISDDKEGRELGVARQEQDCRELARQRGWEVAMVLADNDISASGKKARPGWEALLQAAERHEITAVVAYSSSRMYRRPADLQRLIDLTKTNGGLEIATVASGRIDLTTADGRMIAGILAQVDQAELERAQERGARKRREKVEKGEWLGGYRPFGYKPEGSPPKLVVVPTEAALIQEAAEQVLNGVSIGSITRRWAEDGILTTAGNAWTKSHISAMLGREHPGILNPVDHRRLVDLFAGRKQPPRGNRGKSLLTGLAECGKCSSKLIGRPRNGAPGYVCVATGHVHLGVARRPLDRFVCFQASRMVLRNPEALLDPASPLVLEREAIEARLAELGEEYAAGDTFARSAARKLQAELERIDLELATVRAPEVEADRRAGLWGELVKMGMPDSLALPAAEEWYFARLDEITQDPRTRAWLETVVARVVVKPARRGANAFDPDRIEIEWRPGVEPVTLVEAS